MSDNRCLIIKLLQTPAEFDFLTRLKQIEAVRIFARNRTVVYLDAVVREPNNGEIIIQGWGTEPAKYNVADIEWIEYATRGTPGEYTENRRSKL